LRNEKEKDDEQNKTDIQNYTSLIIAILLDEGLGMVGVVIWFIAYLSSEVFISVYLLALCLFTKFSTFCL